MVTWAMDRVHHCTIIFHRDRKFEAHPNSISGVVFHVHFIKQHLFDSLHFYWRERYYDVEVDIAVTRTRESLEITILVHGTQPQCSQHIHFPINPCKQYTISPKIYEADISDLWQPEVRGYSQK